MKETNQLLKYPHSYAGNTSYKYQQNPIYRMYNPKSPVMTNCYGHNCSYGP